MHLTDRTELGRKDLYGKICECLWMVIDFAVSLSILFARDPKPVELVVTLINVAIKLITLTRD